MSNRTKMEIVSERVNLFKAIKKSRTKGMSYTEMLKHVFDYQQKDNVCEICFDSRLDRNLINVHMPYLKRDGVVKCSDGRYRCMGYIPKNVKIIG